ncbi:MAG TPA: hypothetical protein VJ873_12310, partial [bacterium]|nr:hypothetical protein [bacterium]
QNMLLLLEWNLNELEKKMLPEKELSRLQYAQDPLDDTGFEHMDGRTFINLTGDNTGQPGPALALTIAQACRENAPRIEKFLSDSQKHLTPRKLNGPLNLASRFFSRGAKIANSLGAKMESMERKMERHRLK